MSQLSSNYLILWGSQTGNAEWIAKNIHTEATKKGYTGQCFVMNDYEQASLESIGIVILVCSNTGDGDAPDNALKFWKFLYEKKDKGFLKNTKFTVLGLGDSNYSNFNNTGRCLEKKFQDFGGSIFYEKGLADDAEALEDVVDPWIEKLWEVLPTVLVQKSELSIEDSIKVEKQLEKKMTELEIVSPYSMKGRREALPGPVDKYTEIENSLIDKIKHGELKSFPLEIDLTGLEPGAKLTGLPRVSVPVAKLTRLGEKREKEEKGVPAFVPTPAPITYAPVTMVACLSTADAVKRTLEVELDVGEGVDFEPGDAFGIIAPNDEDLLQAILRRLSIPVEAQDDLYSVEGDNLPSHLQKASNTTLVDLFRYSVDLTSQPRKALLRMLADHTTDPKEKLSLMYICSKQGAAVFNAIRDECPNLLDILETFPSCQPPIERLLDLLPAHMPRYYSISSSPLKRNGKIRFAFNVVEYVTVKKAERKGVATPWIDRLTEVVPSRTTPSKIEIVVNPQEKEIKVPIFIRPNENTFTLPVETERPLILIGPGTGVTPFIGFLEHRQMQRKIRVSMGSVGHQRQIKDAFGPIHLYYGFRNKSMDFLFEKELGEFEADGTITRLCLAESRASDGSPKVYVQDLIKRDSDQLYDLIINKDAAIYICGDAKGMAKGVQDALVEMLVKHQNVDVVEANKILFSWIASRKYLRDLWA